MNLMQMYSESPDVKRWREISPLLGLEYDPLTDQASLRQQALREAVAQGKVGLLNDLYGDTYQDQLNLLSDLGVGIGQRGSKDETIIMPASPTGYAGDWQFDPIYGSDRYKTYAEQLGSQLGMTPDQVAQAAGQYALQALYDPSGRQAFIGDNRAGDFNRGLAESILNASGQSLNPEMRQAALDAATRYGTDTANQLYSESDSSGFLGIPKGAWKDIGTFAALAGGAYGLSQLAGATGAAGGAAGGTGITATAATPATGTIGTSLAAAPTASIGAGALGTGLTATPATSGFALAAPTASIGAGALGTGLTVPSTAAINPGYGLIDSSPIVGETAAEVAANASQGLSPSQALKGLNTANKLMGGLGAMQAGMSGVTGIPYQDVQYNRYQFNPTMNAMPTDFTRYGTRPEHNFVDWSIQSLLA